MTDHPRQDDGGERSGALGAPAKPSIDSEGASANEKRRVRRALLMGAAGGGLVLLTIFGRPVWARSQCTYSGQLSGNLSRARDTEPCGGEGRSPGYWMNHPAAWHPEFPPYMLFNEAFGVGAFPGRTLMNVLVGDNGLSFPADGSPQYVNLLTQLGAHSVAALQNAATPISYDLTVAEVIETFRHAYMSGDPTYMEITKNSLDSMNNLSG